MIQDYRLLSDDEHEAMERETTRTITQALQQYSREAKEIFETADVVSANEVIVLAEDLTQYALEVAELYPINKRYAGFIDYKRARWLPTFAGLLPQVLLVDAKASTENNRDTLQASQLPMDAEFVSRGAVVKLPAGVDPHLDIASSTGVPLHAVTTSVFVHFYYRDLGIAGGQRHRELLDIFILSVPHNRLKRRYNPDPTHTFFGAGKHSPARGEDPRIRVYFPRIREMQPWRLQQLTFAGSTDGFTIPSWRDRDSLGAETNELFLFLTR